MKKLLILSAFLLLGITSVSADGNLTINSTDDEYSFNDEEPFKINASSPLNIDSATIYTNETGTMEEQNIYTSLVNSTVNGTELQYEWTNENNMLKAYTINYTLEIEKDNETYTENSNFTTTMQPEIKGITTPNPLKQGDIAELTAKIVHPIGRGRINDVEFVVTRPNGVKTELKARKGEKIEVEGEGKKGYIYKYEYIETERFGDYQVDFQAYSDYGNDTREGQFTVQKVQQVGPSEVKLNPFYIGQASIIGSISSVSIQNSFLRIFLSLLALALGVGIINIVGDAGTERNRFN